MVQYRSGKPYFLIVEDDADDQVLIKAAIKETSFPCQYDFCKDGIDLFDCLRSQGRRKPAIILLDLNLPRKDGRQVLAEIKANAQLRCIPIIVLSTSSHIEDIKLAYHLGSSGYIVKPASFEELVIAIKVVFDYWFRKNSLPL